MKYLVVICMFACFFMTSCIVLTGWDYFVQGETKNYQVIKLLVSDKTFSAFISFNSE